MNTHACAHIQLQIGVFAGRKRFTKHECMAKRPTYMSKRQLRHAWCIPAHVGRTNCVWKMYLNSQGSQRAEDYTSLFNECIAFGRNMNMQNCTPYKYNHAQDHDLVGDEYKRLKVSRQKRHDTMSACTVWRCRIHLWWRHIS